KSERTQEAHPGRHARFADGCARDFSGTFRSCRSQTLVQTLGRSLQENAPHLGRRHLSWAITGMGSAALSLYLAAGLTSRGAKRLRGSSQALGGGTHLCLADSMPTFGQGL